MKREVNSRSRRASAGWLRGLVAVVSMIVPSTVLVGQDTVATAQAKCNKDGQIRDVGRGWSKIKQPEYSELDSARGYEGVRGFTVDPDDANRIYATNKITLWRSDDGGCTWKDVWHVREPEASHRAEPFGVIHQIYVPANAPRGVVYASIDSDNLYPPVVHLLKSTDAGATWSVLDGNFPNGMIAPNPNVGVSYPTLASGPSDANVLYYSVKAGVDAASSWWLYTSKNGGKSWTTAFDPVDAAASRLGKNQRTFTPVVDPLDPKDVWVYHAFEVIHSTDGGATWSVVVPGTTDGGKGAKDLEIFHQKKKPAQILVVPTYAHLSKETRRIFRSDNGGKTFYGLITPDEAQTIHFGKTLNSAIVTTDGYETTPRVFRLDQRSFKRGKFPWVEITAPGYTGRYMQDLDAGGGGQRAYYWRTYDFAWAEELIFWKYSGKV